LKGELLMKKTVTFGVLAATALTLAACSGNTAKAPEEEAATTEESAPAEADAMAPEDAAALEEATAAAEGTDTNSNPVGPAAPGNPVGPAAE
jgi:ABC-type oligopeptide transport system substrate-binding subunit